MGYSGADLERRSMLQRAGIDPDTGQSYAGARLEQLGDENDVADPVVRSSGLTPYELTDGSGNPVSVRDLYDLVNTGRLSELALEAYFARGVVVDHPGDGTDATAAIQAAVTEAATNGGPVYFNAGIYGLATTIDLPTGTVILGSGPGGQNGTIGNGPTRVVYTGTGYAFTWALTAPSALFAGISISDIHIQGNNTTPDGGIYMGNGSNAHLRNVTVSDFRNAGTTGTGIRVGTATSTGAQYTQFTDVIVSSCDIGIDVWDHNGLRVIGGLLEDDMPTPRAGTYGIRFRSGADTNTVIGTVIQGWETLVDIAAGNNSFLGVRCEGFTTAYNIAGSKNNITGGSIDNYINGATGTGINITSGTGNMIMIPSVSSVTTKLVDSGTQTTAIYDPAADSTIASTITELKARTLRVNKSGAGAQNPQLTLESNALVGPTLKTDTSFARLVLDHAFAGGTGLSFRLTGTELFALASATITAQRKLEVTEATSARVLQLTKTGTGAQDPIMVMRSGTTDGPTIGTTGSFVTMFLDHAYTSGTRMSFRVRGVEALAIGNGNTVGFYGTTPQAQPTAVADATDAATAISQLNALLARMRTVGLIQT